MLFGHGDDGYLYEDKIVANFSSNVYYPGLSEGLKAHLSDSIHKVLNYPEADAHTLKSGLARLHGLCSDNVLVTNGATEAFYLIAQAFRHGSATIVVPSFSEYEDACSVNELKIEFLTWNDLSADSSFKTDLVFICNPNNPTGAVIAADILAELIKSNSSSVFVIDEAYIDFTNAISSSVNFIKACGNVIIVRSLTKAYAIPGLRLGYILSNEKLIHRINGFKMPWSVNALALEAGNYILRHKKEESIDLESLLASAACLQQRLNTIPGITAFPSNTNFFLCQTEKSTAASLKKFLVREYGLLIRDASNFRTLSPQHFRIATQTDEENQLLLKGIKSWTTYI